MFAIGYSAGLLKAIDPKQMKQNDTAGCNFVVLAFSLHALSMEAIEEQSGFTVGAVSSRVCSRTGIADEAAREKVAICAPAHRNRQFVTPILSRGCLFPGEGSRPVVEAVKHPATPGRRQKSDGSIGRNQT